MYWCNLRGCSVDVRWMFGGWLDGSSSRTVAHSDFLHGLTRVTTGGKGKLITSLIIYTLSILNSSVLYYCTCSAFSKIKLIWPNSIPSQNWTQFHLKTHETHRHTAVLGWAAARGRHLSCLKQTKEDDCCWKICIWCSSRACVNHYFAAQIELASSPMPVQDEVVKILRTPQVFCCCDNYNVLSKFMIRWCSFI